MARIARQPGGNIEDVIKGMSGVNAQRSADICEWGCRALLDFAKANEADNIDLVVQSGGLKAIRFVVDKHPEHLGAQMHACQTLGYLLRNESARETCKADNLIEHVCGLLDTAIASVHVIQACLSVTIALARDENYWDYLIELNIPARLSAVMAAHADDALVQQHACETCRWLGAKNADIVAILHSAGVLSAVVAALDNHGTNAAVVLSACETIGVVCHPAEARTAVYEAGVVPLLVAVLATHGKVAATLQAALRAIARMAQQETPRVALLSLGATDIVVAIMNDHKNHLDVQLYACWALLELAAGDEDDPPGSSAVEVVDAVLTAVKRHNKNTTVAQYGCLALDNLAQRSEESRVHIAHQDGCKLILSSLRKHMSVEGVARTALHALATLSAGDAKMHEHITQLDGITTIVALLAQHRKNEQIQANALHSLANLALHGRVREVMDRASVVGVVLESWQAHPLSPSVSVFAAYSLEHLAEEGSRRVRFSEDASQLALNVMKEHQGDPDLNLACIRLLLRLAHSVNERVIAVTPYVTAVCTCLNHHMDVHDVVQCALAILAILCENAENRDTIRTHHGIPHVLHALSRYPGDEEVQHCGVSVLGNLAFKTGKERKLPPPILPQETKAVIDAFHFHPKSAVVVLHACAALRNICSHLLGREQAARGGAIEVLFNAANQFPDSENILFSVCATFNNIAKDKDLKNMISMTGLRTLVTHVRNTYPPTSTASRAAEEVLLRRGMGGLP